MKLHVPEILFEDNHCLVALKPPNLPTQADSSGDADMLSLLKEYIKEKYNKPGNVYLGLVHRLDRPVGGVMLFARTSKAASRLSETIKRRNAEKRYAAVVCGHTPKHGVLKAYLRKNTVTNTSHICEQSDEGAKYAELKFTAIKSFGNLTLLDIHLSTGRHHQIRVQLANEGFPIWGDHRYNPEFITGNHNIALFCYSMSFEHPISHEFIRIAHTPKGHIWEHFSEELKALYAGVTPVHIDEQLIIADKPTGLPVANADGGNDTLESRLKSVFADIYPVHRLDATTSGLVVLARNRKIQKALEEAFKNNGAAASIKKIYRCTVAQKPPKESDTIQAYLVKDAENSRVKVYGNERYGSKNIITRYRLLANKNGMWELEVEPVTGRTHQIRAHLAFIGCPIIGDDKYGEKEINRLHNIFTPMLRAVHMEIKLPNGRTIFADAD